MFRSQSKGKLSNEETGIDFYNPVTHQDEEQFSYQIEIEKQYLQRLKVQRQKIQGLYSKYDVLLSQMKKKDGVIRQKQDKMKVMDSKVKELELSCQELNLVRDENREVMNENMALKHRIVSLENENSEIYEQMKLKECLVSDEKNELDTINDQLQQKVKQLNNKLFLTQQELKTNLQLEKQRTQTLKTDHLTQICSMNSELNMLKNQLMKKDEAIHMLKLDSEFLQQKLSDQEENYSIYLKDLEMKIEKNQKEKKLQIKALKDTLEEKALEISTLQSRLTSFKREIEVKDLEIEEAKKVLREEKKVFDEDIFQVRTQMNNQKLYFREQLMYCQNHIEKLEKKLTESLKRQKELGERIKRFEANDAAKRNLREIQRQQMEKINKILSFQ